MKPEQHTLAAKHPRGAFQKEHWIHSWNSALLPRDLIKFSGHCWISNNEIGTDNIRFGFLFFNLTVFFLSHDLPKSWSKGRAVTDLGLERLSGQTSAATSEMHLKFSQWGTRHHSPSREKTSRDGNGPACEPLERSHEGFPFLETSARGYPEWIMRSPPSNVLQCCSSRTCLMKFPSWNLQENQSFPEQGNNRSAPTADEPQNHGLVLALHLCRGVKEEARGSLAMSKKPTPDNIFHPDQTSNATPVFLLVFGCLGFCASKWSWTENDKEMHLHSLPPHITHPLWAKQPGLCFKVWKRIFLTATKDTVSHLGARRPCFVQSLLLIISRKQLVKTKNEALELPGIGYCSLDHSWTGWRQ